MVSVGDTTQLAVVLPGVVPVVVVVVVVVAVVAVVLLGLVGDAEAPLHAAPDNAAPAIPSMVRACRRLTCVCGGVGMPSA
jgi:hypothetical protein